MLKAGDKMLPLFVYYFESRVVFTFYVHTSDLNCSGCPVARSTGTHFFCSSKLFVTLCSRCLLGWLCVWNAICSLTDKWTYMPFEAQACMVTGYISPSSHHACLWGYTNTAATSQQQMWTSFPASWRDRACQRFVWLKTTAWNYTAEEFHATFDHIFHALAENPLFQCSSIPFFRFQCPCRNVGMGHYTFSFIASLLNLLCYSQIQ